MLRVRVFSAVMKKWECSRAGGGGISLKTTAKQKNSNRSIEWFRMEGLLRSLEQPPAQSRAGSDASCSGLFCSEEIFSPNLPSWKFCVCESPLLCCTTPGFLMTTGKPLLEGQSPTSRRQRSGLRDGRIAEHSFLKKDFVSGWLWPLCWRYLFPQITELFEMKSCFTWLPAALNGTARTPEGHHCFPCFYKDTNCPCVTRWLEII